MYNRMLRVFSVIAILFLFGVVFRVSIFAKDKEKIYVSLDNYTESENSEETVSHHDKLKIQFVDQEEADLIVPISNLILEENISVESDVIEHRIYLTISNFSEEMLSDFYIKAKESQVIDGYMEYSDNQIVLEINCTGIFEAQTVIENGHLYIQLVEPKELYSHVIVMYIPDRLEIPSGSEDVSQEESCVEVGRRMKSLFSDSNTKVYLVRSKTSALSEEDILDFVVESDADLLIEVNVSNSPETDLNGIVTYYNPDFYIPFFGNVQLADYLEYYSLKETRATVLGIKESEENSLLSKLYIPAAEISIGYVSNEQEQQLLNDEQYINKISLGIYNGIIASLEAIEKIEVE